METQWWFLVAVLGIAVAIVIFQRSKQSQVHQAQVLRKSVQEQGRAHSEGEETSQREERRLAGMSAEDRAWEQASLQRNREAEAKR